MASTRATTSTPAVASTSSLHPHLTFRDRLCFARFLFVPLYVRFCTSPSLSSLLSHIYIIGTTGISIVHFRGDIVSLRNVGDVVYGLAVASIPGLCRSYSLTARIIPDIEGWRGGVIDWAFITSSLMFLLPEEYSRDVEELSAEYKHAYPAFDTCVAVFCAPIVWCCFGGRGYSWYGILVVWAGLASVAERVYLIHLNYRSLCRSGKTVRENSWSYKDISKKPGRFVNGYGKELTVKEMLLWHATGSIKPRA